MKPHRALPLLALLCWIAISMTSCYSPKDEAAEAAKQAAATFYPAPGQTSGLQFDHLSHVFGPVPSGTVVMKEYHCKNLGSGPITIKEVKTSCPSCITIDYPKDPIPVGEVRTLTVRFDTKGKQGRFERLVSVILEGSPYPIPLYLNGDVQPIPGAQPGQPQP